MRYVIRPEDPADSARLGGKARALASLTKAGLPVPRWFVVAPEAFLDSLDEDDRRALDGVRELPMAQGLLTRLTVSGAVQAELVGALEALVPDGGPVAVRSSAVEEDSAEHSFAGQLDSFLYVAPADVPDRIAAVWRSGFGERLLAYRRERGLTVLPAAPAVVVQRMVEATEAGVAFSADPVSGRRGVAVLSGVFGLGSGLVSGECDADTWHVDREGRIVFREIADKRLAHVRHPGSPEGVRAEVVAEIDRRRPVLDEPEVRAVADLARAAARHFGCPQDIEWAIEQGRLHLLQSRPITSLAAMPDPDGVAQLWDNSNVAESYSGVTTPLTFSFALMVYEEVYRQFCRIMGVSAARITENDLVFRHMLGLIRGRIYYNLLNWYRLLALLPGFAVNRRFMEQMMGVREGLPDRIVAEIGTPSVNKRVADGVHLASMIARLVANHFRLPRDVRAFRARLDEALARRRPELEELRLDELAGYYHDLESRLLTRWDAPLVNDFFAMVFFGLLGRLCRRWCHDGDGTLQNDLLCAEGGMISAEPARRITDMAVLAASDPGFVALLCDGPLEAIQPRLEAWPEFAGAYRAYLDRFGDRCLEELKLESPTLHDDPSTLLRSVGRLARSGRVNPTGQTAGFEADLRGRAEERVNATLSARPVRRTLFRWVLRHARARVRERENLRFERTRLFGRVRRIFLEIGRRLAALGVLDEARDVFWLEVEEILGFVEASTTVTDLRALVAVRAAEFARFRDTEPPADRFETRGAVHAGNAFRGAVGAVEPASGDERRGIGCCPGRVRGVARVVRDPRQAQIHDGEILVAERTDPGWVMLFPAAAGLVVQRGSLLSHSAIVARELALPAVVGVPDVMGWLRDGDLIELDGAAGTVRRIGAAGEARGHVE